MSWWNSAKNDFTPFILRNVWFINHKGQVKTRYVDIFCTHSSGKIQPDNPLRSWHLNTKVSPLRLPRSGWLKTCRVENGETKLFTIYPPVNTQKAIENGPFIVDLPIKVVMFHSYVSLPEGIIIYLYCWMWGYRYESTNQWRKEHLWFGQLPDNYHWLVLSWMKQHQWLILFPRSNNRPVMGNQSSNTDFAEMSYGFIVFIFWWSNVIHITLFRVFFCEL